MSGYRDTALYALAVIGLSVSALLLSEYLSQSAALCGAGGACDAVRRSAYASILGIPLPVFGLALFTTVLGLGLSGRPGAWHLLTVIAGLGALGALGLIILQIAVIDAVCPYCMVVDSAAIALGILAIATRRTPPAPPSRGRALIIVGVALIGTGVGLAVPQLAGSTELETALDTEDAPALQQARRPASAAPGAAARTATLPGPIAALQKPGVVTIVEYVDFQCPNCRALYQQLSTVLPEYGDRVQVVYRHVPLRMHPLAPGAARAAVCAEELGHGKDMIAALFRAPDLTAAGNERTAEALGIPLEPFRACVAAERSKERVLEHVAEARELGVRGVPTLWIGSRQVVGALPADKLRTHIDAALLGAP